MGKAYVDQLLNTYGFSFICVECSNQFDNSYEVKEHNESDLICESCIAEGVEVPSTVVVFKNQQGADNYANSITIIKED